MQVFKIDENGFFVETVIVKNIENLDSDIIVQKWDKPLHRPKWTGVDWIEGLSQEEINELNNQPQEPTEIEKLQQEVASTNAMVLEFMETILMGGM